jgi:hypothetical protein
MPDLKQTLVFLIHAIKQFLYGFEQLNEIADELEDGCAAKAFYMNSFYNYIAVFFLLDKRNNESDELGGTIYRVLKPHGLEAHLSPIAEVLRSPIGSTTFGEIVRVFRNKAIVHTSYVDTDLERIYSHADMTDSNVANAFHDALWQVYFETKLLPLNLIDAAGLSREDFGIYGTT